MDGLAGALTGFAVASILVKAGAYLASLAAAGSALFAILVAGEGLVRRYAARVAFAAAVAALTLTVARLGLRASFLSGETVAAAFDPLFLSIVMESPLGTSTLVRAAGLVLVPFALLGGSAGAVPAGIGAVLVAASFAFVGHALGEPRFLLGALVAAHVLGVAFWVGAFAPLHALALHEPPAVAGEIAHRFGRIALWVVGGLIAAGMILSVLLLGDPAALSTSAYGRILLLKVALVAGLLGLAALNKEQLTPALLEGRGTAANALRRSIRVEAAAVVLILLATATLTTVAGVPPADRTDLRQDPDRRPAATDTAFHPLAHHLPAN